MNKTLLLVSGLLLGMSAYASDLAQLTLAVSTEGPDTYADGQPLQVGETYLLVYVAKSAAFQGVYTDGSLVDPVNNKIAIKGFAVAGSKCGYTAIQYPADLYPADGSWVIVALDTRTAEGTVGGLVAGLGVSAKTAAASGNSTSLNSLNVASKNNGVPVLETALQSTALANIPVPQITAVVPRMNSGKVDVSFKNIKDNALYQVESTTDLSSGNWTPAAVSALGQAPATRVQATRATLAVGKGGAAELPVAVEVPQNDKVRYFRVKPYGAAN
jgi:hypothetical protein